MISAHTSSADLVARILHPLARSLEEARQHLALEGVDDAPAEDEPAPAPDHDTPLVWRASHPQRAPASPLRSAAPAGFNPPQPAMTPPPVPMTALAPARGTPSPTGLSGAPRTAGLQPLQADNGTAVPSPLPLAAGEHSGAHASIRAAHLPTSAPTSDAHHAHRASAAMPGTAHRSDAVVGADQPVVPPRTATPPPTAIRLVQPDETPPLPSATQTHAESPPPAAPRFLSPSGLAATLPTTAHHRGAPPDVAPPTPSLAAPKSPAGHWRVRAAPPPEATLPAPTPADDDEPPPPAPPRPAPSQLPRNPALTRVMQAMEPVLDKAWQLTDAALPASDDAPPAATDAPRVTNQFNVTVALGGEATDTAGRDPHQLEDALVALLRDAARRQGLDV